MEECSQNGLWQCVHHSVSKCGTQLLLKLLETKVRAVEAAKGCMIYILAYVRNQVGMEIGSLEYNS